MLEVRSRIHVNRYFADKLYFSDLFKVVHYFSYLGDVSKIPSFYLRKQGVSCFTDLTKSMDEIMAKMKPNTRNEIRRAMKEGCVFEVSDDLDEFVAFYNAFCDSKGLDDYASKARILKYKNVLITKVRQDETLLARHVNILDREGRSAFLMFSCSERLSEGVDRKLIGWGNKFLHYKDLEYLKDHGYVRYDWSGICLDPKDERYTIGQFKLSFGGEVVYPLMLRTPLFAALECTRVIIMKLRRLIRGRR